MISSLRMSFKGFTNVPPRKKKVFFDGSSRDNEHDYDVAHKDPNSPYNPHIFMTVPIRLPDPSPPSTPVPKQKQKNNPRAWLSRTFSKEKKTSDLHVVQMTRAEYLKYWARDANGKYIGTAPEGEGIEIWRNKLGVNRRDSAAPPTSETSDFAISRPELPLRSLST